MYYYLVCFVDADRRSRSVSADRLSHRDEDSRRDHQERSRDHQERSRDDEEQGRRGDTSRDDRDERSEVKHSEDRRDDYRSRDERKDRDNRYITLTEFVNLLIFHSSRCIGNLDVYPKSLPTLT